MIIPTEFQIGLKLDDLHPCANFLLIPNEIQHSEAFAKVFEDLLRYVPQRKSWFYYDETHWVKDEGGVVVSKLCKILSNVVIKYADEYIYYSEEIGKKVEWSLQQVYRTNARKWSKLSFRQNVIKDSESVLTLNADEFDKKPHLLNLQNGTFDLNENALLEHSPEDYLTKIAPVEFIDGAYNERWNSFINEIMCGDEERALYLQKAMGYSLGGDNNQECLFILYGATTRNGKGTLMESILGVLGDYGTTVRPETLASSNRSASTHSEDIARLNGVRLASISEPPKSMQFNASLVKTLTGGDTINARFLNENSFNFKPQMKIYINTNYLPSVNDNTIFSSNRIVVIPFDRHFSPEEQDKTLKTFFATDELKSAILNWLLDGYELSKKDFTQPSSVKNAINSYEKNNNHIYIFLTQALNRYREGKTPMSEAHRQYSNWARANGYDQMSLIEFSRQVNKLVTVKKARVNGISQSCICDECSGCSG